MFSNKRVLFSPDLSPGRMLLRLCKLCWYSWYSWYESPQPARCGWSRCWPQHGLLIIAVSSARSQILHKYKISPPLSLRKDTKTEERQLKGKTSLNFELQREEMAEEAYMLRCCIDPIKSSSISLVFNLQLNYWAN